VGPRTTNPARYIRFIYNRVILEITQVILLLIHSVFFIDSLSLNYFKVRAAAVTALGRFGAECPQLRPSIIILLKRCLLDSDDEVRDRATFYLSFLVDGNPANISEYILDTLKVCKTECSIVLLKKFYNRFLSLAWNQL
jgi:coatomer protein complex subunit gamma